MTSAPDPRKCLLVSLLIVGCLSMTGSALCAQTLVYEGRVVDADTLAPLEGALVVAVWKESRGEGLLYKDRLKVARESLTDKNGRWAFTGPVEGGWPESDSESIVSFLVGYRLQAPSFYVYCKGYVSLGRSTIGFNGFIARPFRHAKTGIAGILLFKPGDTDAEKRTYREKYSGALTVPLVPIDNPHERLKRLDFDFEYAPNTRMISSSFRSNKSYVVYGLQKRRRKGQRFSDYPDLPPDDHVQVPILYRLKQQRSRGYILMSPQVTSGRSIEIPRKDAGGQKSED